jgi:hypothetical protein
VAEYLIHLLMIAVVTAVLADRISKVNNLFFVFIHYLLK